MELDLHLEEYFTLEQYEGMLSYLDGLRESGVTNMLGAAPYLEDEFNLPHALAKKVLISWIRTYAQRHPR